MKRAALLAFLCLGPSSFAVRYRCIDLGAAFNNSSRGFAVNGSLMVVGETGLGEGGVMYWTPETGLLLPGPSATRRTTGAALGVNESGTIVGYARWGGLFHQPFVWSAAKGFRMLKRPGTDNGFAWSINESGWICGSASAVPYRWDPQGNYHELPQLPGRPGGYGTGINDSGVMCGYGSQGPPLFGAQPVRWRTPDTVEDLGLLPGYGEGRAYGINNAGTVVGSCSEFGLGIQGFIAPMDGSIKAFGPHGADLFAVNDRGEAVGRSSISQTALVVMADGSWHDLNNVTDDLPSGWVLAGADGINSHGDIAGAALVSSNRTHAVLLIRTD